MAEKTSVEITIDGESIGVKVTQDEEVIIRIPETAPDRDLLAYLDRLDEERELLRRIIESEFDEMRFSGIPTFAASPL